MKYNFSILKFALKRFILLTRDRGLKYSLSLALSKRKQLISMLSISGKHFNKQSFNMVSTTESNNGIENLVSVIIPIYDRTWELQAAIDSILNQTRIQIITATPMVHRREEANCRFWYASSRQRNKAEHH
ncbi:hypothetical protein, partial [Aeromonas sp. QDB25]|uniref:hypothetical protein n=1 Tax=Aeromonas sp. QDB25 TaxID=2989832 RepID=UPI0022DEA407